MGMYVKLIKLADLAADMGATKDEEIAWMGDVAAAKLNTEVSFGLGTDGEVEIADVEPASYAKVYDVIYSDDGYRFYERDDVVYRAQDGYYIEYSDSYWEMNGGR